MMSWWCLGSYPLKHQRLTKEVRQSVRARGEVLVRVAVWSVVFAASKETFEKIQEHTVVRRSCGEGEEDARCKRWGGHVVGV